jgi:aryl-alcohol dehydrogenase-like predicted oxidoreductase
MEYVSLANSQLQVSRLALGCEPLGGVDWGQVDQKVASAAVARARELGITCFDTAGAYGLGRSEELLSQALGRERADVVIATKGGIQWERATPSGRARTVRSSSRANILRDVDASLRRLRLDCIPLYFIHWPDPLTPIAETMEALCACRGSGKIRHIGVSNFSVDQICAAHEVAALSAVQVQYSLVDRHAERDIVPCCQRLGISVLAHGPLAQGLLTGKLGQESRFGADDRRSRLPRFTPQGLSDAAQALSAMRKVATTSGRSLAQIAIRWVLDSSDVACAISGAKSPGQVEENVGAVGWRLTGHQLRQLAGEVPISRH